MKQLDVTIIILSFNTKDLTLKCIASISKYEPQVNKIIIVDNNSTDGSAELLTSLTKKNKNLTLVKLKENKGFAAGNNVGIKKVKTKYILVLNSDTEFKRPILRNMLKMLDEDEKIGAVSCKLVYPDGRVQATGGYFPTLPSVFSWMTIQDLPLVDNIIKPFHPLREKSIFRSDSFYQKDQDLDWLTGAFFLIRQEIVKKIGLFDENYFMYTEDVDYCYRIKEAGWKIKYFPEFEIVHHGGSSSTKEFSTLSEFEGIKKFYKKFYPKSHFFWLRVFLKTGALWRILVFGIIEGKQSAIIYKKAFLKA